ncbi:MAG: ABC transporter permease subunit [Chloroflexi bacterium]|nr:ABC transporter permease subunit [Chloroflexota bacterium]MDA1175292.1 ABC transporter permease subunit [Chloroflexota bacterium]
MRDPLFRKSMQDLRGQVLGWGLGMGVMLALTVALFPSISDLYGELLSELPDTWAGLIGDGDLSTLGGYLSVEFFSYAQIAFAVFAILAGGALIVGEETNGTMDLLLSQPVTRLRVAVTKLAAFTASLVLIVGITGVGFLIPAVLIGEASSLGRFANAFLLLLPFEMMVALAAAMLAQLFASRLAGGMILAGILVASYMLDALSGVSQVLVDMRPIYLTSYFQGPDALNGDVSWVYLGVSLIAVGVLAIANVVFFIRRDIAVGGVLHLPKLRLLHRS